MLAALERHTVLVEEPITWTVNVENPSITKYHLDAPHGRQVPQAAVPCCREYLCPSIPRRRLPAADCAPSLDPGIHDHAEFEQILRSCQNVEQLELEIDSGSGNADPSIEKITLLKLRIVRLSGWRWPLSNVSKTLAIPPNANIAVHLSGPDDEALREQSISAVLLEYIRHHCRSSLPSRRSTRRPASQRTSSSPTHRPWMVARRRPNVGGFLFACPSATRRVKTRRGCSGVSASLAFSLSRPCSPSASLFSAGWPSRCKSTRES